MLWRSDQLNDVDQAVADATAGRPTLLSIEGDAGQGKSTLLREVVSRAAGFQVLWAEGVEAEAASPYATLGQWPLSGPVEANASPFVVAQLLRSLVDLREQVGPVLLAVDDLQWADPESVETLVFLLGRAAGDRLLMVAATRPLRAPLHPAWRRLLLEDETRRLILDGLQAEEARRLVDQFAPGADARLVTRLRIHTGGNPLYLKALLTEHRPDELAEMEELPAPGDLTAATARHLRDLPEEVAGLVRAVAVLGNDWTPLPLAGELMDAADPAELARVAAEAGLLDLRNRDAGQVRMVHALIRSAVHESLSEQQRHQLHLRAAELVGDRGTALQHRLAATDRYDDSLADELADHADDLHRRGQYRDAAAFLRSASAVTTLPAVREQRWLDGLFEHLLARDDEVVSQELSAVGWAADEARRAVVTALLLIINRRWLDGRHTLDTIPVEAAANADLRTRYRMVALRSWTRVMTGPTTPETEGELAWALAMPSADPAMFPFLAFADGRARALAAAPGSGIVEAVVPSKASTMTDATRLAWRGVVSATIGRYDEAIQILQQVIERARDGLTGFSEGLFHAYLGYALWMRGDWPSAHRVMNLARESRFGAQHPIVVASSSLFILCRQDQGDPTTAIAEARERLRAAPMFEAIHITHVAAVLHARLSGNTGAQARALAELRHSFGVDVIETETPISAMPVLHLAIAGVWADKIEYARRLSHRLRVYGEYVAWARPAADWVDGLAAERAGDLSGSRRVLTAAATAGMQEMPLHEALLIDDLARVEAASGRTAAAAAARHDAATRLTRLGLSLPGAAEHTTVLNPLSDRERDVVALLVEGLSYAQMAKELFVTRSTVSFHLTNVYAKTNTSSRHQLVELVRRRA